MTLLGLAATSVSWAFTFLGDCADEPDGQCPWSGAGAIMSIETASFPVGAASHNTIARAIGKWDLAQIPGSGFGTTFSISAATSGGHRDGRNSVALIDMGGTCLSVLGEPLAYIDPRIKNGRLVEADLYVNDACTLESRLDFYDFNDPNGINEVASLETTILHEMGHVAGLGHAGDGEDRGTCQVMNSDGGIENCIAYEILGTDGYPTLMHAVPDASASIGDLGTNGPVWSVRRNYSVGEDERVGLRTLYPNPSSFGHDVAAASYSFPDEEIFRGSTGHPEHRCIYENIRGRTRPSPHVDWYARVLAEPPPNFMEWDCPTDRSTDILPPILVGNHRGSVHLIMTMHQLGTFTDSIDWRLELVCAVKGNDAVFIVSSGASQIKPNTPFERPFVARLGNRSKPIPPGLYNLVLRLDPLDRLDETDETNNVAIWNRQVQVFSP